MSWQKKIEKNVAGDLRPDERLLDGMLVHQAGFTTGLAAKAAGGLVGAAIASRLTKDGTLDSSFGHAASLPKESMVIGLTDKRVLVWGFSKMMGKPKGLLGSFAHADIAGFDTESRKASIAVSWVFRDGSGVTLESPKLGCDAEGFAAAANRHFAEGQ